MQVEQTGLHHLFSPTRRWDMPLPSWLRHRLRLVFPPPFVAKTPPSPPSPPSPTCATAAGPSASSHSQIHPLSTGRTVSKSFFGCATGDSHPATPQKTGGRQRPSSGSSVTAQPKRWHYTGLHHLLRCRVASQVGGSDPAGRRAGAYRPNDPDLLGRDRGDGRGGARDGAAPLRPGWSNPSQ